jgi:hypothetical protein
MTLDLEVNEVEVKGLTSLASVTEITAKTHPAPTNAITAAMIVTVEHEVLGGLLKCRSNTNGCS